MPRPQIDARLLEDATLSDLEGAIESAESVYNPKMLEIKGKYSGRIWLVGNGPSLVNTPLHLLKDEYSFGMNAISLIYATTSWRPSFYLCASSNVRYPERRKIFQDSIDLGIPSFLRNVFKDAIFEEKDNIYWINTPSVRVDGKKELIPGWSKYCEYIVWRYATSMFLTAQIAVYLGFTELYLLGCDLGWKVMEDNMNDPNHFTKEYSQYTRAFDIGRIDRISREMHASHELMKSMGDKYGFNVYNATLGGELEIHPRVNMLDVLQ